MNCNECLNLMDQALELEITTEEAEDFQEHLAACPDCRKQFEEMQLIIESLGDMPMKPLPENFKQELHEKLVAHQKKATDSKSSTKIHWTAKYGKQFSIAAALVLVVGISSMTRPSLLGGNMKSSDLSMQRGDVNYGVANSAPGTPEMAPPVDGATMENSAVMLDVDVAPQTAGSMVEPTQTTLSPDINQNRKVIQTGNMELEVKNYDETVIAIKAMIQGSGGFVQDLSESYYYAQDGETQLKTGYITMRVPAATFDSAFDTVKGLGKIVSQSANAQDITNQYRDTVNMKLNLVVREDQLRIIMAKAQRIEDIILVEGELSRVRGEINSLAGTLQQWDSLVDLATITLSMREVEDFTTKIEPIKKDLWTKATEAFNASMNELKRNFENLVILFIAFIPQLVIGIVLLILIAVIGRFILKKIQKGRKII